MRKDEDDIILSYQIIKKELSVDPANIALASVLASTKYIRPLMDSKSWRRSYYVNEYDSARCRLD